MALELGAPIVRNILNIHKYHMIKKASQIKATRAFVGWSAAELAQRTAIGIATIKRYEVLLRIPKSRLGHPETIRDTFEVVGIEFIGTPGDAPSIRIYLSNS